MSHCRRKTSVTMRATSHRRRTTRVTLRPTSHRRPTIPVTLRLTPHIRCSTLISPDFDTVSSAPCCYTPVPDDVSSPPKHSSYGWRHVTFHCTTTTPARIVFPPSTYTPARLDLSSLSSLPSTTLAQVARSTDSTLRVCPTVRVLQLHSLSKNDLTNYLKTPTN